MKDTQDRQLQSVLLLVYAKSISNLFKAFPLLLPL